jgi:hypothetical protein
MSFKAMSLLSLAAAFAGAPLAAQSAGPATAEPTLEELRTIASRYREVDVALADGYLRDPSNVCETAGMAGRDPALGVMGIHFFRPDLLGVTGPPNPRVNGTGTHTDFRQPAVLIYEPQADGSLELVAVENLVFLRAWEAAGNTAPPTYQGVAFNRMEDDPATEADEAHHFEPHYDLHVWIYRENPAGTFAQFNTAATCSHHKGGAAGHH